MAESGFVWGEAQTASPMWVGVKRLRWATGDECGDALFGVRVQIEPNTATC
jgi:hypothetical protein